MHTKLYTYVHAEITKRVQKPQRRGLRTHNLHQTGLLKENG